MQTYEAIDVCRLCGGADFRQVISFGETPLANNFLLPEAVGSPEPFAPLEVIRCVHCFSVQLRHTVDPRVLFEHYLYVSGTSPVFRKHFADYAAHVIEKLSLAPGDFVVDIGSNDGVLLGAFKEKGMRICGIEPAKDIAEKANAAGIETVNAFLSSEVARDVASRGHAKVVTANNVFAHVHDLRGFASAVRELLADDGVYIFEVQYLKDLLDKNLFDIIYHEHIFYHHLEPLQHLFASLDMEVFDIERVAAHGGSIRVFVQKKNGPRSRSTAVDVLLAEEVALNTDEPYAAFRSNIETNKRDLQALVQQLKADGAHIAGYGAPAKATTFCYAFDIGKEVLDFIVDDSPLKQGRVMPGTHIPIVSRDELYERKPSHCLILAWNFADPIMEDTSRFANEGGVYIIPVPHPHLSSDTTNHG